MVDLQMSGYLRPTVDLRQANMPVMFAQFIKPSASENHHLLIT